MTNAALTRLTQRTSQQLSSTAKAGLSSSSHVRGAAYTLIQAFQKNGMRVPKPGLPTSPLPSSPKTANGATRQINFSSSNNYHSDYFLLLAVVTEGNLDKVKLLHQNGANLAATDTDGNNALHVAAEQGNVEVAEYLLKYGVSHSILGVVGDTPLQQSGASIL